MIKAIGLNKPQLKMESLKKLSYAPLPTNSKFSKNKNFLSISFEIVPNKKASKSSIY